MSSGDGERRVRGAADGSSPAAARVPAQFDDPSGSPREAEIVALLRQVGGGDAGPDAATSARMRARLMEAIGSPSGPPPDRPDRSGDRPGEGTEVGASPGRRRAGSASPDPSRPRRGGRPGHPAARRPERSRTTASVRRARRLSRATGAMGAVLALAIVAVVLSAGALPGEVLYGLKRTSESAELALTSGPEATARKHLDLAALRLDEVSELVTQNPALGTALPSGVGSVPLAAGVDPGQALLVSDNLGEFDAQTREGVRLLLPLSALPSGPPPSMLSTWARARSAKLESVAPSLAVENGPALLSARALLEQVSTRAGALDEPVACPRTGSDEWGPVPACPPPAATAPSASEVPDPTSPFTPSSTSTSPTSTTLPETTADPAVTSDPDAPVRPVVPAPAPVVPRVPAPPNVTPPAIPLPPAVPLPGLPRVNLPPQIPNLPGLGGG